MTGRQKMRKAVAEMPLSLLTVKEENAHQQGFYFVFSPDESENSFLGWSPAQAYPADVEIFQQQTPADAVYFIERGMVKLSWLEPDGHRMIIGLRRRGWLLGTPAVLLQKPYFSTGTTLTRCSLRRISAGRFRHLVEKDHKFALQVLQVLTQEICNHIGKVVELGCKSAQTRLENFLREIILEERFDERQKTQVQIGLPLKKQELAEIIAVTPEHLCRMLKKLKEEGIIKCSKGALIVLDPTSLLSKKAPESCPKTS
jgi:CRP/FNR family transcriptional regulator